MRKRNIDCSQRIRIALFIFGLVLIGIEPITSAEERIEPAPSAAPLVPEPELVHVTVNSNRPAFLYEHTLDESGSRAWKSRCSKQPCEARVRPYELYYIGGPQISSSSPFHLPPHATAVTLNVRAGSRVMRSFGSVLMGIGTIGAAIFAVTGGLTVHSWLGDGLCHFLGDPKDPSPCPTSDRTRQFGGATVGLLVGSLTVLIVGGILHRANYLSKVEMKVELVSGVALTSRGLVF